MSKHVAVLMGGWSAEREVSLVTGRACAEALRENYDDVTEIDAGHDAAAVLAELKPAVVFNAMHGRWGEDGCVQGILEVLQIPYTHSGVMASAVAMHKPTAKTMFAAAGIRCPDGIVAPVAEINASDPFERPYIVKPLAEGSTCGIRIIEAGDNAPPIGADWDFGADALAEDYIPGLELSVAVMDGKALGVVDIRVDSGFYDYAAKYSDGGSDHIVPAPIHQDAYAEALRLSEQAHRALGCRGVTRTDFRYDNTAGEPGILYLLEINTQPGMTPTSIVPEIAAHRGLGFAELVAWMVEDASCER
jgi:D-alanine-D-alanine ligase